MVHDDRRKKTSLKINEKRMSFVLVYADGSICLDILQRNWSPTYDVCAILTSIRSLLNDPNPNSPANNEAAKLFVENRRLYESKVRKLVEESIIADQLPNDSNDTE